MLQNRGLHVTDAPFLLLHSAQSCDISAHASKSVPVEIRSAVLSLVTRVSVENCSRMTNAPVMVSDARLV